MPITKAGNGTITYIPLDRKDIFDATGVIRHSEFAICDHTDQVKQIQFDPSAQATNTTVIIKSGASVSNITLTLPTTTGTLALVGGSGGNSFTTIQPDFGTSPTASSATDTLSLSSSDASITVTGNSGTKTINFAAGSSLVTLTGTQELTNKTLTSSVAKGTWTTSGTWIVPAHTLGGNVTFSENTEIVLVTALSADGKYCGITTVGTAGATLAFGDLVYFDNATSRWKLVIATADSTSGSVAIGICVLAAASNGSATNILLYGKIRADAKFPTLTVAAPVYAGTTAGTIQVAQPSATDQVIRIMGYAMTTDELWFKPSNDYMTHV